MTLSRLCSLALLVTVLCGCAVAHVPNQRQPVCSWDSTPPVRSKAVCGQVFATLSSLARAEKEGDDATVRRLVTSAVARQRIISYGASLRRDGVSDLHVVPSVTLDVIRPSYIGAGFYVLGKTRKGRVNAPQTLYLQLTGNRAIVAADQPNQEW